MKKQGSSPNVFQKTNAPLFTVVNLKRSPSLPSPIAVSNFREVTDTFVLQHQALRDRQLTFDMFFFCLYIQFLSCWQLFNNSYLWLCNTFRLASTGREVQPELSVVLGLFSKADLDISLQHEFMALWDGSLTKISVYFNLLLSVTCINTRSKFATGFLAGCPGIATK